jgi:hypothetical protein
MHSRRVGTLSLPYDESNGGLIVGDGIGVRHRAYRGEPACRCGSRACRYRLDVLTPRLAKVTMHVDEAG